MSFENNTAPGVKIRVEEQFMIDEDANRPLCDVEKEELRGGFVWRTDINGDLRKDPMNDLTRQWMVNRLFRTEGSAGVEKNKPIDVCSSRVKVY